MTTPSGWINCWVEKWLKPHVHTCVGLNLTCFNYFKPRNRQEKQLPRNLEVSCLPWNRKNQSILVRITSGSDSHKEFKQLKSSRPHYLVTLSNICILTCIYQYIYYICILLNMYNLFTPCLSDLSQCVKSNLSEKYYFWVFPEIMFGEAQPAIFLAGLWNITTKQFVV